jgi:hypothetical protein
MSYKGRYKPNFPDKYKGDPTNIIYRSSWERNCMVYFDLNPKIIQWSSEEIVIPYKSPIDGKWHRYFPDFFVKIKNTSKTEKEYQIETILIEVKPFKETIEPKIKKRMTRQYLVEVHKWGINSAKWKAAAEYCKDRNWQFKILTEKELRIK